ncbi:O-antigen ligase family protein [Candidatus Formimonas warabiya]|uniref:O-antigen ligase-related domain-containing protein n=1 Tax=Formimonas warabiya TaxID=1761012 RepID=A0A3G1KNF0_FORW1|nr:O-antigen ligase family protein [Candidatus Formimonas warabiya]ATW23993.1 hypothetical protein DCMF_03585 [Candidatus Formimonas warabiya]
MPLIEVERKTNVVLLLLMSILGLTAVFQAGYSHEMVYYSYLVVVPLTMYYLLKGIPSNSFSVVLHLPILCFLFFSAISLIWTININESLGELYKLVFYLLLYYLAGAYLKEKDVEKLVAAVLIIGTFIALLGILLFLLVHSRRIISVFNNPNPFGMYLAMLSLAGIGIYLHGAKNRWLAVSLVIITDALVLTGSRGSLLAYAIAFPILLLFVPREQLFGKCQKAFLLFFVVAISTFIISSVAPWLQNLGLNFNFLNQLVIRDSSLESTSVVGRLAFWKVAWNMIMARPFTGFGLGTYHIAYNSFRNDDKWWALFAHNNYLQIWAETGIFTLLSFLAFFFLFYLFAVSQIKAVRKTGIYQGILAAGFAFLLHTFVDFTWNIPTVTILFWTFLGCVTALQSPEHHYFAEGRRHPSHCLAAALIFIFLLGSGQQLLAYRVALLGEKAQDAGEHQEAINQYQLACRIFPYRAEYFGKQSENYYDLYLESKDPVLLDQAVNLRQKAINLSPYEYENYGILGRILWDEGRRDEAEKYLRQAVHLGGFTPTPFLNLGYFYLSQEKFAEAERVLSQGLAQSIFAYRNAPGSGEKTRVTEAQVQMHLGLAIIYHSQELYNKEKEQLQSILRLDPHNSVAQRQLDKFQQE